MATKALKQVEQMDGLFQDLYAKSSAFGLGK